MRGESAVVRFIHKQKEKGASEKEIKDMLLKEGWHIDIIQHAMKVEIHKANYQEQSNKPNLSYNYELKKLLKIWLLFAAVIALLLLISG